VQADIPQPAESPIRILKEDVSKLPVQNAILDGEIVCLDAHGISRFNELFSRKGHPILYAFDLLWLNAEDLRNLELIERKQRLCELIRKHKPARIIYAQHVEGNGKIFFQEVCSNDLEGIVAKRKLSVYKDDGNSWLKIKNRTYSRAEGRHELMKRGKPEGGG
jgi:bifunctional non-homologous end joining protein LigD